MTTIIKNKNTVRETRNVRVIEPRIKFKPIIQQDEKQLRVAAYCRVSTDHDEQELSFQSQNEYYTKLIKENPKYIFVGVYPDEGITGTSTAKRKKFNELMKDAMAGKIDMIITKSVTRFARNTLDSIKWIRQLKEKGVDVFFETENLHSLTASELILTLLSAVAQESSYNKSEAIKWGKKDNMKKELFI